MNELNIPIAGETKTLPPPLMEGQTIGYRFYNYLGGDVLVRALAVQTAGVIQWAELSRETVPCKGVVPPSLEESVQQVITQLHAAREHWLRTRVMIHFHVSIPETLIVKEFERQCRIHELKFERRVYPTHETLFVNGIADSSFQLFSESATPGTITLIHGLADQPPK